jgi:hypothetical protein
MSDASNAARQTAASVDEHQRGDVDFAGAF